MMNHVGFLTLPVSGGLLLDHSHNKLRTQVVGFVNGTHLKIDSGQSYCGFIYSGGIIVESDLRKRFLVGGDYFSITGPAVLHSKGIGFMSKVQDHLGVNLFGGPLEERGRLCYINDCSSTLLVPPIKQGDPCLNHLHFPVNAEQTPHTHPSLRVNMIVKGKGFCHLPEEKENTVLMNAGELFIIFPECIHSFTTTNQTLDVITFHPDSDIGLDDTHHPMLKRTIVEGVSAADLPNIQTKEIR